MIGFLFHVPAGEVTAEELRQRLDGAKERVSSQPRPEPRPQGNEGGEEQGSSGEKNRVDWMGMRKGVGQENGMQSLVIHSNQSACFFMRTDGRVVI